MDDLVIADASPLILLARCGRLSLLTAIFGRVVVPETVFGEVEAGSDRDQATAALGAEPGIRIVADLPVPPAIQAWALGAGESQVLTQALAAPGARAVLDDRAARRCAKVFRIPTLGSLGVILQAKKNGLIPEVRPVLDELRTVGMFLSDDIYMAVLSEAAE